MAMAAGTHNVNEGTQAPPKGGGSGALESATPAEITGPPSSLEMRRLLHDQQMYRLELEMQNDELRRTQAELDIARERYFDLYNLAPVGFLTLSRKMVILETNFTAATMLGTTRKELTLRSFFRFIIQEDQDYHYRHTKKLFETREPQVCEVRMVKADGTRFWVRLEASVVQGDEGVAMARVVMSDVTAKRHAEQTLRDWGASLEQQVSERTEKLKLSEDRFRQLSEATFEGVAVSENGILLDGNLRFAEIHRYRLEEMTGRPITDFVAPESRALVSSNSLGDFREAYEYFGLRKDGSIFPAEAHGRARIWQGKSTRVTALRDLTLTKQVTAELQAKQSELERAQQLALVSEVSAGIVHQLAQPLSALGANVFTAISNLEQRALPTSE
ncbi:MAG: PAS domain S-box protein, partial [Akkermansiaceae bacterium]|nr:PAS domain S-box protein [Akkermansiaceae bacterium]